MPARTPGTMYNSYDYFDFNPRPLESFLHPGDVNSTPLFETCPPMSQTRSPCTLDYIQSQSLEKKFCSDFSCCGLALADMHELVDHFEEAHVLVLGKDGYPVYPNQTDVIPHPNPGLDLSYASALPSYYGPEGSHQIGLVVSYPHPRSPAPLSVQPIHPAHPNPHIYTETVDSISGMSSTEISPSDYHPVASFPSSTDTSPELREPACLPPALLTIRNSKPMTTRLLTPTPIHPLRAPAAQTLQRSIDEANADRSERRTVDRIREKIFKRSRRRNDNREKTYKCPHEGCSKSYLNPNGLKYHLEKGTCTIDPSSLPMEGCSSIALALASSHHNF